MPRRVTMSTLNSSTVDIINTIRANASYNYQNQVPEVAQAVDIPAVGDILLGTPALANEFLNALMNRIALVRVNSVTFNNEYAELKKGFLQNGETVEEVFVNLTKAREFSAEKATSREFKRTIPDVRTAFHAINWKVQYPMTIQYEDLRMAFTSQDGVTDLIAKMVGSLSTSADYDEYLLFKYLMIKAITKGKMLATNVDPADKNDSAVQFRSFSNKLRFVSNKFNASGVHTATPISDQYIFMDSEFNAKYDVETLAGAFNMDKADFIGRLKLVDDWGTFDNDRFDVIRENSTMLEEVTADELLIMKKVRAVLVDKEWFQVYDNLAAMTEADVKSGLYWNYFYNVWKTVSSSPFSNAVVFVEQAADVALPGTVEVEITGKDISENATVFTLSAESDGATIEPHNVEFVQTQELTKAGIAVHKFGAVIIPSNQTATNVKLVATIQGNTYNAGTNITGASNVGDSVTLTKV